MDALYADYAKQRIIREPTITGSRLKITIINDDFKDWYRTLYGNTKGCPQAIKDLKPDLEKQYGKCPQSGWSTRSLSNEEG